MKVKMLAPLLLCCIIPAIALSSCQSTSQPVARLDSWDIKEVEGKYPITLIFDVRLPKGYIIASSQIDLPQSSSLNQCSISGEFKPHRNPMKGFNYQIWVQCDQIPASGVLQLKEQISCQASEDESQPIILNLDMRLSCPTTEQLECMFHQLSESSGMEARFVALTESYDKSHGEFSSLMLQWELVSTADFFLPSHKQSYDRVQIKLQNKSKPKLYFNTQADEKTARFSRVWYERPTGDSFDFDAELPLIMAQGKSISEALPLNEQQAQSYQVAGQTYTAEPHTTSSTMGKRNKGFNITYSNKTPWFAYHFFKQAGEAMHPNPTLWDKRNTFFHVFDGEQPSYFKVEYYDGVTELHPHCSFSLPLPQLSH